MYVHISEAYGTPNSYDQEIFMPHNNENTGNPTVEQNRTDCYRKVPNYLSLKSWI